MTDRAGLESELDRDPDAKADPSAEVEDEDLAAHPKDLEDGADCIEIWLHLSGPREEQCSTVCLHSRIVRDADLASRGDVFKSERVTDSQITNDECRRATEVPADRREPVGKPIVRGDPAIMDDHTREAVGFDPANPDNLTGIIRMVRSSSGSTAGDDDHVFTFRGAAACAAFVHGVGSYKRATERTDGGVSASFIREWARVHDLPRSVRRHVAHSHTTPTAVKHIARVPGDARLHFVWVTLDTGLTIHEVRRLVSGVNDDTPAVDALADHGVDTDQLGVALPADVYLKLRRRAPLEDALPGDVVADALDDYLS